MFSPEPRLLYNLEAEQALLGALMLNNSGILKVAGTLSPNHFADPTHACLYQLMLDDMAAGRKFTAITLAPRLGQIDSSGNVKAGPYLVGMTASGYSAIFLDDFAETIIDYAAQRNLQTICQDVLLGLQSPDASCPDLTAQAMAGLQDITGASDLSVFRGERDVGLDILGSMSRPVSCTSTGFPRLDEAMGGGMYPGCVYGFMGRFKSGKTIWAGTISDNLSMRPGPVKHVYFALEMGSNAIHQRKLARRMDTYPSHFRDEQYRNKPEHTAGISAAVSRGGDSCIYANTPGISFERLQRLCATAVYRHKIGGLILDYWQLVTGQGRSQSKADHLEEVAQWIAEFVKKHDIWAIVLGQINQTGNTRGSEGSQLAFDQVYDICRPEDGSPMAWLEPRASRYTQATAVGSPELAAYRIEEKGPYFREYPA